MDGVTGLPTVRYPIRRACLTTSTRARPGTGLPSVNLREHVVALPAPNRDRCGPFVEWTRILRASRGLVEQGVETGVCKVGCPLFRREAMDTLPKVDTAESCCRSHPATLGVRHRSSRRSMAWKRPTGKTSGTEAEEWRPSVRSHWIGIHPAPESTSGGRSPR